MEELAKLMLEKNLITTKLAALVIRGLSKSSFTNWIMAEPKQRDFSPPIFKIYKGNSDLVKHIFQFQQKMALESSNETILSNVFPTTLTGSTLIWFH